MAAHYSIAAAVIDEGRAKALRTVNVVSLILALGVGALLAFSLPIGAVAEAVGDIVSLAIVWGLMSRAMSRRTKSLLIVLVAGAAAFGISVFVLASVVR